MLDFYFIQVSQSSPNSPESMELEFAGAFDDKTFHNLQKKGIIADQFDFYSDFRLGTAILKQILEKISINKMEADSDVKKLLEMIHNALEKECGLIAFGD